MEDPSQASEHSGATNTTNMPSKSQESGQASPASTIVEGNKQQTETAGNEDGHDSSESDIDLNEPLDEKDWVEFESRYHKMVDEVNADEEALLAEFQSLLNVMQPKSCVQISLLMEISSFSKFGAKPPIHMKLIELSNGIVIICTS